MILCSDYRSLHKTIPLTLLLFGSCGLFVMSGTRETANAAYFSEDSSISSPVRNAESGKEDEDETDLLYDDIPLKALRVSELSPQVETDMDYVDVFFSEWEDCRYIFLPATADRSRLVLTYQTDESAAGAAVRFDDTEIVSGAQTDLLSTKDSFTLYVGDIECGEVRVMQSDLGCIYLHTSNGGLDFLDAHKSYTEIGNTLMLDAKGTVQYNGDLASIKSHGNSSWDYSKRKHPYNIKLDSKANLYGMGKAKKWTLLSNFLDFSQLRNTIAFELAKQAGIPYTTDYVYVDLYADGSYRGTYQLTERVQIQKNRVDITDLEEETEKLNEKPLEEYAHLAEGAEIKQYQDNSYKYYDIPNNPADITGGYLVQFQLYNRYPNDTESGFVTTRGQAVDFKSPKYASKAQVEYMRDFMQDLEDAIYSEDGYNSKGKHYSDYVDMDSLLLYYLIEEITTDADGTYASFYFYKESDAKGDGKLHCAPVWDFDLAFMNFSRGVSNSKGESSYTTLINNLYTVCQPIHGWDPEIGNDNGSENPNVVGISWIGKLYEREDIVKRIAELYYTHYDSYLRILSDAAQEGGALISRWGNDLNTAAEMNNAKTHMYGGRDYRGLGPADGESYPETVEFVRVFVEKRRAGLRAVWLEPFAQRRTDQLQAQMEMLNPARYDEKEQQALSDIVTQAAEEIAEAGDMDQVQAIYDAALQAMSELPRTRLLGDFNDDLSVDIKDAQTLLMYYGNSIVGYSETLTATQQRNADVDASGLIDAVDAMHILRYAASSRIGNPYIFPAAEPY